MEKKISRTCFLDLLRIIACFLVIVNHTNSSIFLGSSPDHIRWYISLAYFFLCKIAVPVFFMISGYLMLTKVDTWKKTFNRFFRILVVLVCGAILYSLYYNLYVNHNNSLSDIFNKALNFYKDSPTNAFWYLYAYLAIILMMPFLQKMVQFMTRKDYHIFFLLYGVFFGVLPILRHYSDAFTINSNFNLTICGGYVCVLLIGSYFARFEIKKTRLGFLMALVVLCTMIALNVILTLLEYKKSSTGYLFLDNRTFLPIIVESVCVFYMASFLKMSEKISKAVTFVGSCTFGIYLVSDMTINFLTPIHTKLREVIHPLSAVLIFEILVFLIGFIITVPLKKIPIVKKYI